MSTEGEDARMEEGGGGEEGGRGGGSDMWLKCLLVMLMADLKRSWCSPGIELIMEVQVWVLCPLEAPAVEATPTLNPLKCKTEFQGGMWHLNYRIASHLLWWWT